MGQLGVAPHPDGHVPPQGLGREAPELGVAVHGQPQADWVATDPDSGGLRKG